MSTIPLPTPSELTVTGFQKIVDEWIKSTPAGYFSPLTNMAVLAEETGEVARVMARRFGDQSCKPSDSDSSGRLAEELADVVRVCCAIASQCGIDLADALLAKHRLILSRDAARHIKKTIE